ncbi:hypothetical protein [Stappia phage SI01]|uniref:DNA-directed DNA polymerase family A palm domain-containing protein n=1 Tax=Stappia phage SI01 TaxID=2847766 RepID=A0AAE7VH49_9CAUD|nr:hypothetical protein [Stappia phage SI01]
MYMVFDLETTIYESHQRKANPWDERNWIVAQGWKLQRDPRASWRYFTEKDRARYTKIPAEVTYLVGHNIKFDLLWELTMGNPDLQAFFKRGGKIWCTQYAEYLLHAQVQEVQMNALNDVAPKYGGTTKIDAVKALWEQGVQTYDIPEDLLIDYLVGTEEEGRNAGDIGNTEKVFLGQLKLAKEKCMVHMIQDRMDGLLATTEMEFRGLKVDVAEAGRRLAILNKALSEANAELASFIPDDLPFEFNWNSPIHASCLIFGGTAKYPKSAPYKDENGEWVRKKASAVRYKTECGDYVASADEAARKGKKLAIFKSGARKGEYKTRIISVPGEIKTKIQEFHYTFPGYTAPKEAWQTSRTDAIGAPIYSSSSEVMDALGKRDMPFTKALSWKQKLDKEIGTYYVRYDERKKSYVGMLTCVRKEDHIIHHNLNHTATVTTRLSSSKPNLQNIPRNDRDDTGEQKSQVKALFVSRFGNDGVTVEADYSQLEVVVQGVLTGDKQLCQDLRDKVDFHCKRVAAKFKNSASPITYMQALDWCKNEKAPDHSRWKKERTKCKIFSFQRAYGAGAETIAEETGMTVEEVRDLIDAEDEMYPGVVEFNRAVEMACRNSARPFQAMNDNGQWQTFRRGYWQAPTGTLYSWRTYPAQEWQRRRGETDSFSPPEMKNYPVQGTGGEFVQAILGLLWRHFVANDNYGGKAFLVNTVHDCVWIDCHKDVVDQVCRDVKRIMECIPEYYNERYGMNITVPFPVEVEVGQNMNDLHHWSEAA